MKTDFEKAKTITFFMMQGIIALGIVAWFISAKHEYGATSEAKLNFLRLIVIVVGLMQVLMAAALKKIISASSGKEKKILTAQITADILCEAPAIFGFGLVLISKNFMDYAVMGGMSLVALALLFPKENLKG